MKRIKLPLCFIGLLFCAQTAYADAGLPMIIMVMPTMIVLLIPFFHYIKGSTLLWK